MADPNRERPGSLVETHKGYNPRIIFFYFVIVLMLLTLAGGLAYQQLVRTDAYHERERQQNQRRIVVPGPRGNIYDRDGRLLVGNRPRFAAILHLDELQKEFRRESIRVRNNYRELKDKDIPTRAEIDQIARYSIVQRYLDRINAALGRTEKVDADDLNKHFRQQLLLPYTLLDDLKPEEYARLLEQLPVQSPLQVYATSTRFYPYGSAAAHTLGYVTVNEDIEVSEDLPGAELTTFKMKGSEGKTGLEKSFDEVLQGQAGGSIYRVDPSGYRIDPPLERHFPVQGKNLDTSLDIDLQTTAEDALGDQTGAVVALDIRTGEVLVLASKPNYNLSDFSPRISAATVADIEKRGAWYNLAIQGVYPPGSTFKIIVSTAALRSGTISADTDTVDCQGSLRIGGRNFTCDNGLGHHGVVALREAIAKSCDVFFYTIGLRTTPEVIAAEARRFQLDKLTGIELPSETHRMIIPDPEWKQSKRHLSWNPGDTANMSIGQGDVDVTPLSMACFVASFARGETTTVPTLLHDARHSVQRTTRIGLTPEQRAAIIDGMAGCVTNGTASKVLALPAYQIPGVRIAGKTGTAQYGDKLNIAWFICFAPIDDPEIAVAVAIQSDTPGEDFGGGRHAAPIAASVIKKYFEKKQRPAPPAPVNLAPPKT